MVGLTGCGKTTLAKFLIEDYQKPYSVTWNPTGSDSVYSWKQKHVSTLPELYDAEENSLIYTPSAFLAEDEKNQAEFFSWIYDRKNTRIYIAEASSIVYTVNNIPLYLPAVLNRGRERVISSLTATQRPTSVPLNILSESEHYYVFKLLLPSDRQRIEAITGITVEQQADLQHYEFYYFSLRIGLLPRK